MTVMFSVIGWIVVSLGAGGLVLALFVDRSRGRRRCPRCHYDLSGSEGLRCQECGREHRHEGRLYLTRRHWRWAIVGALVMASGWAVLQVPRVRAEGWVVVTPTWWMVWNFDRLDDWGPRWTQALRARMGREGTSDRTRRALVRTCIEIAGDPSADVADRVRGVGIISQSEDTSGYYFYNGWKHKPQYKDRVSSYSVDFDGAFDALLAALQSEDPELQRKAAHAMGTFYSSYGNPKSDNLLPSRYAYPAMASLLAGTDPSPGSAQGFIYAVGQQPHAIWRVLHDPEVERPIDPVILEWAPLVHDRAAAIARLIVDSEHASWEVSALALWGLLALDADTEAARAAIVRATFRGESDVREAAVGVYAQLIERGHLAIDIPLFVRCMNDPDSRTASGARAALLAFEPMPVEGVRMVIKMLGDPKPKFGLAWVKRIEDHLETWDADYDPALLAELRAAADAKRALSP